MLKPHKEHNQITVESNYAIAMLKVFVFPSQQYELQHLKHIEEKSCVRAALWHLLKANSQTFTL